MNKIGKGILIAIIVLAGLILIKTVTTPITPPNKYAAEAVRILEKYKEFGIDAKEAAERIDDINREIKADKKNAKNHEEEVKLLNLSIDLDSIYTKLRYYGKASGYEVDEAIKALEEHY